ncbi:MAG: hypothetical protein BRD50_02515 [Bacteroidetes bacterium SW_11_45_7]|nr:MAG: hypothetical protein BRD50_02515 [Bacteroidetes bacterium SW_11_45_7]
MFLPPSFLGNQYVQLGFATPVFLLGLYHFGKSAWHSLKAGIPNMDVLITIGGTSAFIYSLTGTILGLGPEYLFYETSAMIFTLVLLGNLIEHKSVQRTTTAIEELTKLQPAQAKRLTAANETETIDHSDISKGDTLLVNTGDRVPADGTVIKARDDLRDHPHPGTGWVEWRTWDIRGNHVLIEHDAGEIRIGTKQVWMRNDGGITQESVAFG